MAQPLSERIRDAYLYADTVHMDQIREWVEDVRDLEQRLNDLRHDLEYAEFVDG